MLFTSAAGSPTDLGKPIAGETENDEGFAPIGGRSVGASALGLRVQVLNAGSAREIDTAYASLVRERAEALVVAGDGFFNSRRVQLAMLAVRHAIPATYSVREYPEAGGLISYGTSFADTFRQIGIYCGRILKGTRPADLPVMQSTKFELVINMQAAKMLGLDVPWQLQQLAEEVIE
jgi:putative ABC transport system substrate-binding protein